MIYRILFLFIAVVAVSCSQPEVNPLHQTWSVSDVRYEEATTDSASITMLEAMKNMMKGTTYAFDATGNYTIAGGGTSKSGKYKLSEDGKTFTLGEGEQMLDFQIVELTPAIFSFKNPKMPVILVCVPDSAAAE